MSEGDDMNFIGNLIWFVLGGLVQGLGWFLAGVIWCITIVGIPIGLQCFKFASISFTPFGKKICYGGGAGSLLLNIIWLLITGIPMALVSIASGFLMCLTIIGIPFGLQSFKMAKLALMPFGSEVVRVY